MEIGVLGAERGTERLEISSLEFDVLWEHYYGLDQMPLVLRVPSPGKTDEERDRIVRDVWDGLAERGLGTPVDPHPVLPHLLALLRRPDHEIDGRLWIGGGELRLLAAATGDEAVLATLAGGRLALRFADATGLPRHALSVLPAAPAGAGQSITLPTADFAAAAHAATKREELTVALRERGVRDDDARTLTDMIGDLVHRGQYGSAGRDRWGRRVRRRRVLSFFDTEDGRYLQVLRAEEGAAPWTTISPAGPRRMLQHLTDLHGEPLA